MYVVHNCPWGTRPAVQRRPGSPTLTRVCDVGRVGVNSHRPFAVSETHEGYGSVIHLGGVQSCYTEDGRR